MANITLQPNDGALKSTLTITKQNNSQLTLNTANTFADQNIQLTFNVQSGSLNIGGGELSKGDGIATLANAGYYNGSTYNASDVIDITTQTTEASGYYKITASGYGKVNRAAITKQVRTAGWLAQDTSAVINSAAITGYTSNTGTHDYYIKKSTLSTNTITSSNNNQTVTVYKGYYPTDRTITINGMEASTIKSGSANITSATYTYNASTSTTTFAVTGSATVSTPSVPTAGYVSSTVGTKQTNTATLNTTVNKIAIKANNSGTTTKKPVIAKQAISISGVTDAANGNATTTAPSSGVYVAVKSPANTGTLTSKPTVITTGYGTADSGTTTGIYTATDATSTVGAEASDMTYVPIRTANPTFTGGGLTVTSSMAVSPNTNSTVIISDTDTCGAYISSTGSANRAAVTYANDVNGYVIKGSGTVALAATSSNVNQGTATKKYINGVKIYAPSGDTERYFDVTVPNGSTTEFITFRFKVDKNGNVTVQGT